MPLYISSLNSGSNGNCYYVGNDREAVLVDAGISCRETEKRMRHIGLSMDRVKAVFISHEHTDHIKGLETLASRYQLPVYITDHTYRNSGLRLQQDLVRTFTATAPVSIGGLIIHAFRKFHDACDPHSFTISDGGVKVGVFTDIGRACSQLSHHFSSCHAAFLEANYDCELLEGGRYPIYLKNRIRGGQGHLSNDEALELFRKHRPAFMSHLLLAHLSKENNCPDKAANLFRAHAAGTEIIVAGRHEATSLYEIVGATPLVVRKKAQQLQLF